MTLPARRDPHGPESLVRTGLSRILVIDDDFGIRTAIERILLDEGYEVDCAASGAEALFRLELNPRPPALIILDLWMPYMNGFEFRAIQKNLPGMAEVPVLVLTAAAVDVATVDLLALSRLFVKPVGGLELLAAVDELVSLPRA